MLGRTFPLLRPGIGKENRHDGQYSDRGKVDRRRQIGILHQVEEEQGCQCKMETSHINDGIPTIKMAKPSKYPSNCFMTSSLV